MKKLIMSALPKTWLIDIDGVVFEHNGHLKLSGDILNKNVKELFLQISDEDVVIFLTSRGIEYKEETICALKKNGLKFDHIIFALPKGERVLVNDIKPDGLKTAIAINTKRNELNQILVIRVCQ